LTARFAPLASTAMAEARVEPDYEMGEGAMLAAFLDWHRATVFEKCEGLTAEQMRTASVPPSGLTPLGIVRHLAENERWWFRDVFGQQHDLDEIFCTPEDREADFHGVADADPEADLATLRTEIERARAVTAGRHPDDLGDHPGKDGAPVTLRFVSIHMIAEYARHLGHLDLLRERIDGATGD
jgi:hypothetical protein